MNTFQKIIKYCALAFAISIIAGIVSTIYTIYQSIFDTPKLLDEYKVYDYKEEKINDLNIEIKASKFIIKKGDFKLETNNEKIESEVINNKLIVEDNSNSFKGNKDSDVIIYIPEGYELNNVNIKIGAGTINIDEIITNNLDLEFGAGKVEIDNIVVNNNFNLETGAGSFDIKYGNINKLNSNLGMGKISFRGIIKEESSIECGIGKVDIELIDEDNYSFNVTKGIGSININGNKVNNDEIIGNGNVKIIITGGIGKINIDTNIKVATQR